MSAHNLPLNFHQIFSMNNTCIQTYKNQLQSSGFELFVYPFSEKETTIVPVLSNTTDQYFGFDLKDCKISGYIYVQYIDDMMSSSATKSFTTCKQSQRNCVVLS